MNLWTEHTYLCTPGILVKPEGGRKTGKNKERSGEEEEEKIVIVGKHTRPPRTTAETRVSNTSSVVWKKSEMESSKMLLVEDVLQEKMQKTAKKLSKIKSNKNRIERKPNHCSS